MRNRILIAIVLIAAFFLKGNTLSFAGEYAIDPREAAIDRAVGGMEEGSRILSPGVGAGQRQVQHIPGKGLSPSMDTRVTTSAAAAPSTLPMQSLNPNQPVFPLQPAEPGNVTTVAPPSQIEPETPTVETPPIEEPPIIETPIEIPVVETPPIESPIEETIPEPVGEETDRSIIEADVGANLSGDEITVDADLSIEPQAEGGLLDAEADTTTDIVQEELTTETGLEIDVTQDTTTAESILGTETGTTDSPPSGEVEAGLEADIEGTGAGDDVAADAADGLSGL